MRSFDVGATSTAAPAVVWSLLTDASGWPTWSPVDALEEDRSEGLDPGGDDGVGAVRAFRTGKVLTREQITELDRPTWFRYQGVENPQMSDYRASIELRPTGTGGTAIRWRGTFTARPGRGAILQWYLRRFMQRMADGLAAHAEQAR